MPLYLAPYNMHSISGRDLSNRLNITRIKLENSNFKPSRIKTIINWGRSDDVMKQYKRVGLCNILNDPFVVEVASNKRSSFLTFEESDVRIPEFTSNANHAHRWLEDGHRVVTRKLLRASSAKGMKVYRPEDPIDDDWNKAILYVKYIPKIHEYRVHVFNNEVIDIQRKGLRAEVNRDDANFEIRNLENGFIFVRNDGHVPNRDVNIQSINAIRALGLDFGAVDVVWNENRGQAYVLEVNTAPGLTGTTLNNYVEQFRRYL